MKDFKDKVAVITGAADGIGRAMADRFAQEGMKVVLADIDKKGLIEAEEELKAAGAAVLAVPTDVSKAGDVEALAARTLDTFGGVHLLCNNAGVGPMTWILGGSLAEWEWIMGVNLWGVIHGVRVFAPIMIEQNTDCHIVNTSSRAGLICAAGLGLYRVTKHAVVALSETLYHELAQKKAKVGVSVLCPAQVKTGIMDWDRRRPAELRKEPVGKITRAEEEALEKVMQEKAKTGLPAEEVADLVFDAVRKGKFYIFPHPELKTEVRLRMEDILQERNPTNPAP
ncbi:MAG: SDR family NAD(P)-dependent oxidoreductase [Desulfobacterales bacterium]|nr:SDR family NAD(P)-dependent oxidoreductase [Desulfobacterales bacterium]